MNADPKTSDGARRERRAFRDYLRRRLSIHGTRSEVGRELDRAVLWVLKRQQRYDIRPGGLGKR